MNQYEFYLDISPEQYVGYYRGAIQQVVVRSTSGQTVQFPASRLQKFVTHEGIRGGFVLVCDANHKCVDLHRVPVEPGHGTQRQPDGPGDCGRGPRSQ